MKMKAKLRRSFVFAISTILFALWLPSPGRAADYPQAGDFAQGAKSWANNCSRCHNMRDPQDLRDDQWITTVFHMRVRAGLSGQQTRDILTFLQASNSPPATAEPDVLTETVSGSDRVMSGAGLYNQTCIACHGGNGKGTVPGAPDLTKPDGPLNQSDDVLMQHIIGGYQSPGSPMAMPPKGGNMNLSNEEMWEILVYMKESFGN